MVSPISTVASAPPAAPVATDSQKTSSAPKAAASSPAPTDTVQLSSTAQAQLSALQSAVQEASETPEQTLQEAMGGDTQAQRLLAREAQAEAQLRGK